VDLKPIKDLINKAELAHQIEVQQRKKEELAAKERIEEEKLERRIQEYNEMQRRREQDAEESRIESAVVRKQPSALSFLIVLQKSIAEPYPK